MTKKKKKKSVVGIIFRTIGIILLLAVLAVIAFAAYLYHGMSKMELTADDIPSLASGQPMSVSSRLSFDAVSGTVSQRIDKRDIYWFYEKSENEALDTTLRKNLESAGIILNGFGIESSEDALIGDIDVNWHMFRLRFKIPLELRFTDSEFVLYPKSVSVGSLSIPIDSVLDKAGISEEDIQMTFPYDLCLTTGITDVQNTADGFTVTGPFNPVAFENGVRGKNQDEINSIRLLMENCDNYSRVANAYLVSKENGLREVLSMLQSDPSLYPFLIKDMFLFGDATVMSFYKPEKPNYGFYFRIFPDYDAEHYAQENVAVADTLKERRQGWTALLDSVSDDYLHSKLTMSRDGFMMNKQVFDLETYLQDQWNFYQSFLDKDSLFLGISDTPEPADSSIPVLNKIGYNADFVSSELDPSLRYPIVLLSKGRDGSCWAGIRTVTTPEEGGYRENLIEIAPEQFNQIVSAPVPVWTQE